jgi:uncharacterized protein YbaR (Trm112 family)
MSHHITDRDAIANAMPTATLACPRCGSTELLYAVELVELLTATACSRDETSHDEHCCQPVWDPPNWLERGAIVCRDCGRADLRFGQLVPAALPTSSADTPEEAS